MSQEDHSRATWLDGFPRLRQGDRIAPVQEKHRVFSGELLGDCASNAAARTGDEITLHLSSQTIAAKSETQHQGRRVASSLLRQRQGKGFSTSSHLPLT